MKQFSFLLLLIVIVSCAEEPNNTTESKPEIVTALDEKVKNESVLVDSIHSAVEIPANTIDMETEAEAAISEADNAAKTSIKVLENNIPTEVKLNDVQTSTEELKSNSSETIAAPVKPNHDKWDALARANVSSSGKVNYSAMKSKASELNAYVLYLENFTSQDGWSRNEKLAYWINLYNAATVQLIVKNYPIASITDLSGGKPWDQNIVTIGDKNYSLNDIENKIIRPKFNDARIHFAVNCAAKSCPPLMNKAFTASSLNRYLDMQTTAFINSSENSITAENVEISKIFDWYKIDFEKGDVIAFLNKYSTTPINADATVSYKTYNWELNK